jgi:hypothetical protein
MDLTGKVIKTHRNMTQAELEEEGWSPGSCVPVLVLEDGTKVYPSRDEEGNKPGVLFGKDKEGTSIYV